MINFNTNSYQVVYLLIVIISSF